ncbi:MAG: hypothetical protein OEY31_07470 [Candidatus Bathyarchaeota archaeon]|nr:hypothetical protein [Candidatus Bathyarchaeota archaeon]
MGEKRGLVPYGLVSPGFETVYTGEKSDSFVERVEGPMRLVADDSGNVMRVWSVWTWTWPGQERIGMMRSNTSIICRWSWGVWMMRPGGFALTLGVWYLVIMASLLLLMS